MVRDGVVDARSHADVERERKIARKLKRRLQPPRLESFWMIKSLVDKQQIGELLCTMFTSAVNETHGSEDQAWWRCSGKK
jgi:hypothetical protein